MFLSVDSGVDGYEVFITRRGLSLLGIKLCAGGRSVLSSERLLLPLNLCSLELDSAHS